MLQHLQPERVSGHVNYLENFDKLAAGGTGLNHQQSNSQFNSTAVPFMSQQLKNNNFTEKLLKAENALSKTSKIN